MRKTIYYLITALALTVCGACSNKATEDSVPAGSTNVTVIDATPSITEEAKPTETVTEATATPEVQVTATATPEPTATPVPTVAPTATPVPQLDVDGLKKELEAYGKFIGGPGMSAEDYNKAMSYKWRTIAPETSDTFEVNIEEEYTYEELQEIMASWTYVDGVTVYDIGTSVKGRTLCAVDINRTTVDNPKTIVLTGTVHARETAGSIFIVKQLNDLLHSEDKDEYLSKVRILAVPCVNPDGRDGVSFDTDNFTYGSGQLWKANANGVDLNRNFPGLSWGQIKNGNSRVYLYSDTHTKMYFPGYSAGSEPETKALMKFLQYAIVEEQADILVDYHQQGRIQYAGKPWQTKEQQKRCSDLASAVSKFMANDKTYVRQPEDASYGLRGEGSTLTDYACSLAVGAKFSEKYGFMVYTDGENEYPLIMGKKIGEEANKKFATTTLEIGSGAAYLGYDGATRKNLAAEYKNYHFDELLYTLFDYMLVSEDVEESEENLAKYFPGFNVLDQKEYPTGCESVSTVMLMRYMGINIDVDTFIDNYLPKISNPDIFYEDTGNAKKFVYDCYFVGDPRSELGKACNPPVIVEAVNAYRDDTGFTINAADITGTEFDMLFEESLGTPVLLWVSGELKGPSRTYDLYGHTVMTNRHCVVLLGINKEAGIVTVADPMIGAIREWDYDKVVEQYNLYGKKAAFIY